MVWKSSQSVISRLSPANRRQLLVDYITSGAWDCLPMHFVLMHACKQGMCQQLGVVSIFLLFARLNHHFHDARASVILDWQRWTEGLARSRFWIAWTAAHDCYPLHLCTKQWPMTVLFWCFISALVGEVHPAVVRATWGDVLRPLRPQ